MPVAQLLAKPRDHEQAVVDGHSESDEGCNVGREHRHLGDAVHRSQHGQGGQHAQSADHQRSSCGDESAEHDQEQDQQNREGDDLGSHQICPRLLVVRVEDGRESTELHVRAIDRQLLTQVLVGLDAPILVAGQSQHREGRVAVRRSKSGSKGVGHRPVGDGVAGQYTRVDSGQACRHRVPDPVDRPPVRLGVDHRDVRNVATEPGFDECVDFRRLAPGIAVATDAEFVDDAQAPGSGEQDGCHHGSEDPARTGDDELDDGRTPAHAGLPRARHLHAAPIFTTVTMLSPRET